MTSLHRSVRLAAVAAFVLGFLSAGSGDAVAQESSVTDQGTPSALARGAHPLGSYGGGDVDVVNLFNGNLSLRIPLAGKDGRAGMGASVLLSYNSKTWRSTSSTDTSMNTSYVPVVDPWDSSTPEIAPGWTISFGRMVERRSGHGTMSITCNGQSQTAYQESFTVLTFTAPDGTEYNFRDAWFSDPSPTPARHDGAFHPAVCGGYARGQVWYSTDGTAATFISDSVINDTPYPSTDPSGVLNITGWVFLRDGTRYRIVNDRVTSQEDSNGNRINFTYAQLVNSRVLPQFR